MRNDIFQSHLKKGILLGDGAMGTMLIKVKDAAKCPEALNISSPETVRAIHQAYVNAGSMMIQTNTFGANPVKLKAYGLQDQMTAINGAAVRLAREAAGNGKIIAGGIGPSGLLMEPFGTLSFQDAVRCYAAQAEALADAGCDVILIETMSDLQEARAAVIGARKTASLPILCTMTFDSNERTLTGADPENAAVVLEALGVDALGANCGVGPEVMVSIIRRMHQVTDLPLMAQANAGLPVLQDGLAIYGMTPEKMAAFIQPLVEAGAGIIGGCCGTTPRHIASFAAAAQSLSVPHSRGDNITKFAGTQRTILIGNGLSTRVIGENINPTARKVIREAYEAHHYEPIIGEAVRQQTAGASIIDVNAGVPKINQHIVMPQIIKRIQQTVTVPIAIDAIDPTVTELGLQAVRGKALINSANGEMSLLEKMVQLSVTYGAALLCLTLNENGIPEKAEDRLKIARQMVDYAVSQGMRHENILIDPLTLTAGAQQDLVMETLRAVRMIKSELGVKTVLGVSNISHGLPARKQMNAAFLSMALASGLDLPIINPCEELYTQIIAASDVLSGKDRNALHYIQMTSQQGSDLQPKQADQISEEEQDQNRIRSKIINGDPEDMAPIVARLIGKGWTGLDIIEKIISPALEQVGDWYEDGTYFLPQLLLAAEATQQTFTAIKEKLPATAEEKNGTIVMATVKGDIHDIGKNIVAVMLENHGFKVIDMGKDVLAELIVDTAVNEGADMIGLSALMTTTMQEMERVVLLLKDRGISIPVLVGGAVLTDAYAESIGAAYASDAIQAVKKAKKLLVTSPAASFDR
jgi:5-methyltetrahydrofolate--homocysteine methyltransferase